MIHRRSYVKKYESENETSISACCSVSCDHWYIVFSITKQKQGTYIALELLKSQITSDYDLNIKNQVENAVSLLEGIYAKVESGELTMAEGKKMGADLIRTLSYGTDGYFWVDTYDGTNVVLKGSDTEGTNRMDLVDVNNFPLIKEIIETARQGGGYTDYYFPKPGETEASPKRSYSAVFEPFEWVIGTGNYIDYMDEEIAAIDENGQNILRNNIIQVFVVVIIAFMIESFILYLIGNQIVTALTKTISYLNQYATGNFIIEVEEGMLKRKDDFGTLANALDTMQQGIRALTKKIINESHTIQTVVSEVNNSVNELNSEIESVSATTEELPASMEETSASTETIASTTNEIAEAARNIAQRAEDGASQVVEIRNRASETKENVEDSIKETNQLRFDISDKVEAAIKKVEVVERISVLSESIMSITSQTNLLALNAAIEAVRAGEAGKGFSVVADEIRNLADQSKETVIQIQEVTEEVVSAVEALSGNAKNLLGFIENNVTESFDRFNNIMDNYNQDAGYVNELIVEFSATSEELLASVDSILNTIGGISDASYEGARGTTEIAERTTSILTYNNSVMDKSLQSKESADKLLEEMSQFQV